MNVYLHQLPDPGHIRVLPLAAGLLAAAAKAHAELSGRIEVRIGTERDDPAQVAERFRDPLALGLSCYMWSLEGSLAIARQTKVRHPDCLIVLGGPSVPRLPARARLFLEAHPYVDALVLGEGEAAFVELLTARMRGDSTVVPDGVALQGRPPTLSLPRPRLRDFSPSASPFLDGTFDELLGRSSFHGAVLETNRGCPFSCTYCDWGQATSSPVVELPTDRVRREIEWIGERGLPYLYITDANFGIRPRDASIAEHLAAVRERTGQPSYCVFHLTKNARRRNLRTAETLQRAGIGFQVALSMQDFDADVLASVRRDNISLEDSLGLRAICNERSIPTFNEMILGLPAQTYRSFTESIVKAITPYPGDTFYLFECRLLENTELADPETRARYGIESRRCLGGSGHRAYLGALPEYDEIVVATAAMPAEDWRRAYVFGYLVSATYNLHILDEVARYLLQCGADLRSFYARVADAVSCSPPNTSLGRLRTVFRRYLESIRNGGRLTLDDPETGHYLWQIQDALALSALRDLSRFHGEVKKVLRDFASDARLPGLEDRHIEELMEYQHLRTPAFDRRTPESRTFGHAWTSFGARPGRPGLTPLRPEPTSIRYVPPPYVSSARSFEEFAPAYLGAAYSKITPAVTSTKLN